GTSTSVSGLDYGTTYYWRALATNAVGDSNWSAVRSFITMSEPTLASVPQLSTPANAATGISVTPNLSWNASSGADSYRVQVSTTSNFSSTLANQSNITGTSTSVSGLDYGTTYYWRALATNAVGDSNWSAVRSFTTISAPSNGALVAHWKMDESSGTTLLDA
ncbi:fibronectin type III domain-containing protein, partial [Gillisia marina]|uniref:fibronectin type III domain-containing protein n=1 Tax=Gillisia marina TaxID=1167637 RepID=UPI00029ABC7C